MIDFGLPQEGSSFSDIDQFLAFLNIWQCFPSKEINRDEIWSDYDVAYWKDVEW